MYIVGEEWTSAVNPTSVSVESMYTTMSGLCLDIEVIVGSKCRLGISTYALMTKLGLISLQMTSIHSLAILSLSCLWPFFQALL